MKISIILRGISYLENYLHKYNLNLYTIDFRDTFSSFEKNIIEQYNTLHPDNNIKGYMSKSINDLDKILKTLKIRIPDYEIKAINPYKVVNNI